MSGLSDTPDRWILSLIWNDSTPSISSSSFTMIVKQLLRIAVEPGPAEKCNISLVWVKSLLSACTKGDNRNANVTYIAWFVPAVPVLVVASKTISVMKFSWCGGLVKSTQTSSKPLPSLMVYWACSNPISTSNYKQHDHPEHKVFVIKGEELEYPIQWKCLWKVMWLLTKHVMHKIYAESDVVKVVFEQK